MASSAVAPGAVARPRPPIGRAVTTRLPGLLLFVAIILTWHYGVVANGLSSMLFPAPPDVWRELGEIWRNGLLVQASRETLFPLMAGLILGVVGGLAVGLLIGTSRQADTITGPYMWGVFTTPDVAFVPPTSAACGRPRRSSASSRTRARTRSRVSCTLREGAAVRWTASSWISRRWRMPVGTSRRADRPGPLKGIRQWRR